MPQRVTDEMRLAFPSPLLPSSICNKTKCTCLQNEPNDDVIGLLRYLEDADGAVQPRGGHDVPVDLQVPHRVRVQRDVVQQIPIVATKDFCGAIVAACRYFRSVCEYVLHSAFLSLL